MQQRDNGQIMTIYDPETLTPVWARPIVQVVGSSWSDDGERLAVAAQFSGGIVFEVESGEVTTARCGLNFKASAIPPIGGGFANQPSVCDL
ncbi:MAG: hypothetical protein HC927_10210 [Deltaproteobacteria bacterium]|nr:hypothetical protein [Deltaproteobacteria bacterium]